ncbi:protein FAM184B isoform X2 [Dunckerocampus dactyliophorus]|uniref:protein FAM184B isoform X2 n=1 Tax=Dunckerocampus dactyliophorus TaxID=161453 RepID=UPI0024050A4B|nr:protein FAM184B isoform X2 [Dunckerocampus dactyliophorus]
MASGAGKAVQTPGQGSAVNGNAAEYQNVEQEQHDFQMHNKMCKKIAQLTKVIYSLNMKNEEQEAALQALNHAHDEELHRILMETCHEGEGSALRTRLLQLQESLDEQQRVGAQVQADFECFRMQSEERERETEAELRRDFEERLQAAEEDLQEARSHISTTQEENQRLSKELEAAGESIQELSNKCEVLQRSAKKESEEEEEEEEEEVRRTKNEVSQRVKGLLEEVNMLKEERHQREEESRRAVEEEKEQWEQKMKQLEEEKETMRKKMEAEWREEQRKWEEREEEEKKGMHSALRERVKRAEAEVESHLERLAESTRNTVKLQERIQNLEEELELDRKRVSEAEGVAKRAEEELAVAKERLLLQEDELQTRAEELLNVGCKVCVCADVEELKSQLSRLQSRNRELELQSSGRNNDHARQMRQHAEALSTLRSEMVRAQTEELRRIQKHADDERDKLQREMDKERENLQKEREQEKSHLEKERNRLRREKDEEKDALLKEAEEVREHLRREKEEEVELLRKELNVERVRVRSQLDKRLEQVEVQRAGLQQKLEEEKKRLVEKADEDRKRLKEQVRKAIEEVMRRHAAEVNNVQEALSSEKKTNQEVCAHLEEERRRTGELHDMLERERDEHGAKIKDANNEIFRLKTVIQQQEEKDKVASGAAPPCGPRCSRLQDDLQHSQSRLTAMQEEAEKQREKQQREIASLKSDKHRLEEKVLEQSRLTAERNILEQSQRNTEDRIRAECEDRLRAEFRIEMNAAVAESEQRWQNQEQDMHSQIADLQSQLDEMQTEKKKESPENDSRGNPEVDKLRKEVQETKELNKKLRERLQEPQSQSLVEERQSHAVQLQALERQAKEDVLSERNRLQTMHHLELDKQRAELTQQHTEWSRQMTQRHMQQIEDLQAQLQAHTQMMALQQDLKQQNQNQVFERQLDESRCAMLELQRENATLKKQLQEKGISIHPSFYRSIQANPKVEEKEEDNLELQKTRDARLEEEAQRLKEEVEKLRVEMEKLEESQKLWEERKEEDDKEEEGEQEKKKKPPHEGEGEEAESRRKELEEIRKEHKKEIQNLVCEYNSAQMHLQARIVALENELREREERCRRREPRCDDLQLGKLQERLAERDQLIKRLVEERHQLQLHHPVVGDNSSPRLRDSKPCPGSTMPTMRTKHTASPPRGSTISCSGAYDRLPPYSSSSSTLPHQSTTHAHTSPHYSTSSLPHKHTSLSLSRHSSPSLPRSPRSRTSCVPPTPAPTAPLPVCPSPQTGIRYVSPSCQEPYAYLQAQSIRGPYVEQRGTEALKQEWFTKYFSF